MFLMTWAPEDGAEGFPWNLVQSVLSDRYRMIAEELGALLIPGGDLYGAALNQNPELELWREDRQHPLAKGTYLAACGAYALFFEEDPSGNPYIGELEQAVADELQTAAWDYIRLMTMEGSRSSCSGETTVALLNHL